MSIPEDDGVAVSVANAYPAGSGEVQKVADGALAGELTPAVTVFQVEMACEYPADFPLSEPIPGFSAAAPSSRGARNCW